MPAFVFIRKLPRNGCFCRDDGAGDLGASEVGKRILILNPLLCLPFLCWGGLHHFLGGEMVAPRHTAEQ